MKIFEYVKMRNFVNRKFNYGVIVFDIKYIRILNKFLFVIILSNN